MNGLVKVASDLIKDEKVGDRYNGKVISGASTAYVSVHFLQGGEGGFLCQSARKVVGLCLSTPPRPFHQTRNKEADGITAARWRHFELIFHGIGHVDCTNCTYDKVLDLRTVLTYWFLFNGRIAHRKFYSYRQARFCRFVQRTYVEALFVRKFAGNWETKNHPSSFLPSHFWLPLV